MVDFHTGRPLCGGGRRLRSAAAVGGGRRTARAGDQPARQRAQERLEVVELQLGEDRAEDGAVGRDRRSLLSRRALRQVASIAEAYKAHGQRHPPLFDPEAVGGWLQPQCTELLHTASSLSAAGANYEIDNRIA